MTRHREREGRTAAIELAVFLPLLSLLLLVALSATEYIADRRHIAYVADQASRFATGAPHERGGAPTTASRPTPEAVAAYVAEIADLPVVEVTVTPDPTLLFPGGAVTIAVTMHHDLGPLADVADALAGLVGRDQNLSDEGIELHTSVTKPKR